MKRLALVALLVAACGRSDEEATGVARSKFESAEAVLVHVELDGHLRAAKGDSASVRSLISAQLLYTVGALNADHSVGSYSALDISNVTVASNGGSTFDIAYHAKFPVAWGGGAVPPSYEFVLPRAVAETDQIAFSRRYAATCADPEGGITKDEDASRLWLFLRPKQAGCAFDANDVFRISATMVAAAGPKPDKYPEYRRIWSDRTLHAVYVFSYEEEDAPTDAGRAAHDHFIQRVESFLGTTSTKEPGRAHVEKVFPDGRNVLVDIALVGTYVPNEPPAFDTWFNGVTPNADLIMYSGHAGLGANVRALSKKGTFNPGQYVIWAMNGCDSFAYADDTLADRRAVLNPDDPAGTKYMDTVSNALGSWFHAGDDTALTFLSDLVVAQKTYRQIFTAIDPSQVVVVTGEEDNEDPMLPVNPDSATTQPLAIPVGAPATPESSSRNTAGCSAASRPHSNEGSSLWALIGVCLVALRRRD